jgi:hypothetical protein
VFCAYKPVVHPLDEQGVLDVQFCVHFLSNPPRRAQRPVWGGIKETFTESKTLGFSIRRTSLLTQGLLKSLNVDQQR